MQYTTVLKRYKLELILEIIRMLKLNDTHGIEEVEDLLESVFGDNLLSNEEYALSNNLSPLSTYQVTSRRHEVDLGQEQILVERVCKALEVKVLTLSES